MIGSGFWLIWKAWGVLHAAQQNGQFAITGPYDRIRHPQHAGFMLILVGFLLQWPTIPTLVMFPVLVFVYRRSPFLKSARCGRILDRFGMPTPPTRPDSFRFGAAQS